MGKIKTQALSTLDAIYRFAGGLRSPGEIDIERPVMLVHDVADQAGLRQGRYLTEETTEITAGTGTASFTNVDRRNLVIRAGFDPSDDVDVWLTDVALFVTQASVSNFLNALVAVAPPLGPYFPGGTATELTAKIVTRFDAAIQQGIEAAGTYFPVAHNGTTGLSVGSESQLPTPVGVVFFRVNDGGAAAVEASFRTNYIVLPRGVRPW